jgi:thiaminase
VETPGAKGRYPPRADIRSGYQASDVDPLGFRFVDFLRAELDRVGPAQADLCRDFFRRAVALELSFFEAAYAERT